MRQNGARERLDFSQPRRLPAQRMPRDRGGFYAAAYGTENHFFFTPPAALTLS